MNKKLLKLLLHLIGIAILVFLFSRLDYNQLKETVLNIKPYSLILGIILLIVMYSCKALRFKMICNTLGGKISLWVAIKIYLTAVLLSFLTPGRIGDFSKIIFLKKSEILNYNNALVATIADRIWDVIVISLVWIFIIAVVYGSGGFLMLIAGTVIIGLSILFFIPNLWIGFVKKIIARYQLE